jgi:glycosyltransferase involved in cell wall biosynthesis
MLNSIPKKRLLLITDTTSGQIGGTELNALRFAQALLLRNYEPVVVDVGSGILEKSNESAGLTLIHIPTNTFADVTWSTWKKLLQEQKPAVIIRSKTWAHCINWKLDALIRLMGIDYLCWEHHPFSASQQYSSNQVASHLLSLNSIKRQLKTLFRLQLHIRSVKRTLAVSQAVKNALIDHQLVVPKKIDVIYPGVDFNYFSHSLNSRKKLRTDWEIPESAFVIGSLGRLAPHKGNNFIIKIVAQILEQQPTLNIWCVIAGKGPDLDRLQTLAKELNISERVKFPGWQENAPNAWSVIDVFLMPSADEGLGMTLIEAAACGCVPIAAKVGGMQEVLSGPLASLALTASDVEAWINTTCALASSELRAQHQQKVYQELRHRFDAQQQWNLMADWIEKYSTH